MAEPTNEFVESEEFTHPPADRLLDAQERAQCERLAAGESPHNQRAQALLALDQGATQKDAGQLAGLSQGQVRYWLGKFRHSRMAIFPEDILKGGQPLQDSATAAVVSGEIAESEADSQVGSTEKPTEIDSKKKAKKGKGKKDKGKKGKKKAKKSAAGKKSAKKKKK
jgi:hypothetical protein